MLNRVSIFSALIAGATAVGIMTAGGANAATCISLASPNPGGIPADGCNVANGTTFTNLTDAASDPAILWSGTSHTTANGGNDFEVHVEAALDHVFNQFVNISLVQKLDPPVSTGDFTITPTNGSPGNFSAFDWSYSGSETLAGLTLKAATEFMILDIQGQTSGSVSNTLIFPGNSPNPADISHISFWRVGDEPPAVSEPAVLGLALVGMGSIMWMRRRRT